MKLFFRAVLAFPILLSACNESTQTKTVNGISVPDTYSLHLAPDAGARYNYDIVSESKTIHEIGEEKKESGNSIQMNVSYETSKDSSNNLLFHITYNSFQNKNRN